MNSIERTFHSRLISRSLSKEMKEIFESDARISQYFSCKVNFIDCNESRTIVINSSSP